MNKQVGMHDGIFEVLSRINAYMREGNTLPTYVGIWDHHPVGKSHAPLKRIVL
jgi:hypothetical protein